MSLFGFLDKLMGVLPIQKRKERWKNELENLAKERNHLIEGKCDEKKASRIVAIDERSTYLLQLLKNSADA